MKFEFDNNVPIYIQLVEQLKIYIISEKIKSGERLPSVRDLALQTKVNPNTMQKALVELEELKLIYTERTNGKYITNDKDLINSYKEVAVSLLACSLRLITLTVTFLLPKHIVIISPNFN